MPATNATKPMMRPIVPIPGMTIEFSSGTENTKRASSHSAAIANGLSLDEPANGCATPTGRRIPAVCLLGNMVVRCFLALQTALVGACRVGQGTVLDG